MKLRDFFDERNHIKASDQQKLAIYEQFLQKSWRFSLFKKISFYSKIWVYTIFIVFLSYSLYIPHINNSWVSDIKKMIWIEWDYSISSSLVSADYVWKILKTDWFFEVIKDWDVFDTDLISSWDIVNLFDWSWMEFEVTTWTYWRIEWPSSFSINLIEDYYYINLLSWDYFKFSSNEISNDNLIIVSEEFHIQAKDSSFWLNLLITSEWEKKTIENSWSEVIISNSETNEELSVMWNSLVQIDEETRILIEIKKLVDEIVSNDLWFEFELEIDDFWSNNNNLEDIDNNSTIVDNIWNDTISNISSILDWWKRVLSVDKFEKLKNATHVSFLKRDLENLVLHYLNWNTSAYHISYDNFYSKIIQLYWIFDFEIYSELIHIQNNISSKSIDNIVVILDQLISRLSKEYYIPDVYMKRLKVLLAWSVILRETEFWMLSWQELEFEDILNILWLENNNLSFTE